MLFGLQTAHSYLLMIMVNYKVMFPEGIISNITDMIFNTYFLRFYVEKITKSLRN